MTLTLVEGLIEHGLLSTFPLEPDGCRACSLVDVSANFWGLTLHSGIVDSMHILKFKAQKRDNSEGGRLGAESYIRLSVGGDKAAVPHCARLAPSPDFGLHDS